MVPESYAIIEQGRIGQILCTKPQDRRAVIEEAAGITQVQNAGSVWPKPSSNAPKQNLTRVFDILEEVSRQVNSLKRQASKAKRYGELQDGTGGALRVALSRPLPMLEREAAKTALDLNLATGDFQKLTAQVAEQEQEHAQLQEHATRPKPSSPKRGSSWRS